MGQQTYHGKILDGVDYPWDLFIWSQWKWGHSNCWNSLQAIFVWVIAVKWMHWKVATLHFLKTMELNHMQMNSLFLKELKLSVSQKKIEESKHLLTDFSDCWDPLLNNLEEFKKKMHLQSETFKYWDVFTSMVALLKDLIQSEKEGDLKLHLHGLQEIMPLLSVFDRTNYLRWCFLFIEDMQNLVQVAQDVY